MQHITAQSINQTYNKKVQNIFAVIDFFTIFAPRKRKYRATAHITIHRGVEQLAARRAHNPEVGGSSPPPATKEDKSRGLSFSFSCLLL